VRDAAAELVVPVVEQRPGGGVEKQIAPHVALSCGPVTDASQNVKTARVPANRSPPRPTTRAALGRMLSSNTFTPARTDLLGIGGSSLGVIMGSAAAPRRRAGH